MNPFSSRKFILLVPSSVLLMLAGAGFFASMINYRPWGVPEVRLSEYEENLKTISLANDVRSGAYQGAVPSFHHDARTMHFGETLLGAELNHTFKLQNLGDTVLKLTEAESSSDAVQWELTSKHLAPGEEASLSAHWYTSQDLETSMHWVRLETNDPLRQAVTFILQADIRQPVVVPNTIDTGAPDFGDVVTSEFVVASETSSDLVIDEIESSMPNFEWLVEESVVDGEMSGFKNAKVVHKVLVRFVPDKYGSFSDQLTLQMTLDGNSVQRLSTIGGKVRSPITFIHPEMHSTAGLNIGTIKSDAPFEFAVSVRQRSAEPRELVVLDQYPKEFEVSLQPFKSLEGAYRLVISVPQGTPTMEFNRGDQRGYVSIGDPNDKEFSNWFPLSGAVVGPNTP